MRSVSHYCVNCGTRLEPRTIEGRELEGCPDCGFVLWHDPKVVTLVVVEDERGDVLVGRRGIEPGYGLWCLPGGYVNDDEHPADSAVRECREEIGADVEITGLLGVYHIRKRGSPSMVGIAYLARLLPGQVPAAGSEMLEIGAFPGDGLPELAFTSHREAVADWLAAADRATC
ncbi:MAG TPA: NUDIX domain-containing protein [Candidatus Dormibacteraeota bacterium]|nr:NUDIX domain-containing protein [Candidatus Dormibacteraeota bacterium]